MTARELRDSFFDEMADDTLVERLFSSLRDVVYCLKNRERVYVSANEAFAQRVGMGSRWEVVGKRAEDLFPDVLAEHYQAQDEEVFASGEGFRERLELLPLREGGLGWFLASKVPVRNIQGEVLGLASISHDLRLPSEKERGFDELSQVVALVEKRFGEDLDRGELAREVGLSEQQLERRMKRVFGLSLSVFIRKLRIEHGARLLVESKRSLAEIALECGYSEQSAFTRQFKTTVGIPPGKYRSEFGGWW